MKISKKKLQQIIKEELEMAQNSSDAPYSGPKEGVKKDDLEGDQVKEQLFNIAKYALAMQKVLKDEQELEGWVQSKITLAQDYLGKVKHHLEYELQIDMPEPSVEEINKLMEKEEEPETQENAYAGQGKFYYDV